MKVYWTYRSVRHLVEIYEYIAQDSPLYAKRIVDRLTRRSEQIGTYPKSGRKVPEYERDDIREVIEGRYRIIYRIKLNQVDVLAVIHSAKIPPSDI
ncbi:hypothetical protein ES707_19458 [subsurface metagenome]